MSSREYNKHQQKIIERYYDNLDAIMLGKLQELVTDLMAVSIVDRLEMIEIESEKGHRLSPAMGHRQLNT